MILIGHYDSPFVRRVGVALRFYALDMSIGPGRSSATPTGLPLTIRCAACRRCCSTTARCWSRAWRSSIISTRLLAPIAH
ncbi:MAG: hypothetical protein WDN24_07905 [Sphingomonas sp.]